MYNSSKLWHMPWAWPPSYGTQWSREDINSMPVPNLFAQGAYIGADGRYVAADAPVMIYPTTPVAPQQNLAFPMNQEQRVYGVSPYPILQPMAPGGAVSGYAEPEKATPAIVAELDRVLKEWSEKDPQSPHAAKISSLRSSLLDPGITPSSLEKLLREEIVLGDKNFTAAFDQMLAQSGYKWNTYQLYNVVKQASAEGSWTSLAVMIFLGLSALLLAGLYVVRPRTTIKTGSLF